MALKMSREFNARIEIIGINPFVFVPDDVLDFLFAEAGTNKGMIRVNMTIDGHSFTQTLVKYSWHWRLYLNIPMRKAATKEVGDKDIFKIGFNPEKRKMSVHPDFAKALTENSEARNLFDKLSPSRKGEILRYIAHLKTQESVDRNVKRAINFLLGKERFIGRDKP